MTDTEFLLVPVEFALELTLVDIHCTGEVSAAESFKWFDHEVKTDVFPEWSSLTVSSEDAELIRSLAEGVYPVFGSPK